MEPINIKSELSNYRKAFGLVREEVKKDKNPDAGLWSMEQVVPEGDVQAGWGSRIEMPEELPNFADERVSGDEAMDAQNFEAYLQEHPFAQQEGEELLSMVEDLSKMVQDPENPMTLDEAMREYTLAFGQKYDQFNQGGKSV